MIVTEPSASGRRRLPKQILPKQYLLRCSSANFLCRRFCDSQSFHVQREAITFNQERARGSISIGSELQISTAFHNVPNLVRDQGAEVQILSPRPILSHYLPHQRDLPNRLPCVAPGVLQRAGRMNTAKLFGELSVLNMVNRLWPDLPDDAATVCDRALAGA